MAVFLGSLREEYSRKVVEEGLLERWPLYDFRVMCLSVVGYYMLVLVCYLAVRSTTHRFQNLRSVMRLYDAVAIAWNGYLVYGTIVHMAREPILLGCNVLDPRSLDASFLQIHYFAYAIKFFELADTLFIILNRHFAQLSFLHIYHHGSILIIGWISSVYSYYGDYSLLFFMNAVVHIIMYSYYLFPKPLQFLKRCVTQVQMVQFVLGLALMSAKVLLACDGSWIAGLQLFYYASLLLLFSRFYFASYSPPPALKKEL